MTRKPRKDKPLTRKQAAFVREIIENPKQSATQAALKVYGKPGKPVNYNTARNIAGENLAKPAIRSKLEDYNELVENALLGTVSDWATSDKVSERALALDSAKFVHDKIHGKSTQRVETKSEQVSININLSDSQ